MDGAEAFLRAIFEHPDDDAPRLVYADWLDERGEAAVAAFIRIGCARPRGPGSEPVFPDWHRAYEVAWYDFVARVSTTFPELDLAIGAFERGFNSGYLTIQTATFLKRSATWWPLVPVRYAALADWAALARDLAQCESLRRLVGLSLAGTEVTDGAVLEVVQSPHLGRLRELRVVPGSVGQRSLGVLRRRFGEVLNDGRRERFW